jgi:hypothetical protein
MKEQLPVEYQSIAADLAENMASAQDLPFEKVAIVAVVILPQCNGAHQLQELQASGGPEAVATCMLSPTAYVRDYGKA